MDENIKEDVMLKLERTAAALEKNNMIAYIAENSEEARKIIESILKEGDTVTNGGTMTLIESGIKELLASGKYDYLDRDANASGGTINFYREASCADVYLTSSNAVTENGELYNVDGFGNRVSALSFGPKKVVVIAGYNKVVENIEQAIKRVKTVAAPKNSVRLNKNTYCAKMGECKAVNGEMTEGCGSPERICRHYVTTGKQNGEFKRIHVILVAEELGY